MAAMGYPETVEDLYALHFGAQFESNGANAYRQAMEEIDNSGIDFDLIPIVGMARWPNPGDPVPVESIQEVEQLLDQNRSVFELAAAAADAPTFLYPLIPNTDAPIPMDDFSEWRHIGRLLSLQAMYLAETGDVDGAIDAVETNVLLGERLCEQPTVLPYLVGRAVLGLAQGSTISVLERADVFDAAQLDRLEAILDGVEPLDVVHAVWTDTLVSEGPISQRTSATTVAQLSGSVSAIEVLIAYIEPTVYRRTPMGTLDRRDNRRRILSAARILSGDSSPDEKARQIEALEPQSDLLEKFRVLSLAQSPIIASYQRIAGGRLLTSRLAEIAAIRVMRYRAEQGRLPNVEEFANEVSPPDDPFGDGQMRYRVTDFGFRVYSVGQNRIDDGGVSRMDDDAEGDDEVVEVRLGPVDRD